MRMRKLKNRETRLVACQEFLLTNNDEIKSFIQSHPTLLEIGAGKGDFAVATAIRNPEKAIIAVEKISDAAIHILEKVKAQSLTNLKVIIADAKELPTLFADTKINTLYLNFSDPWPKARHEERRLTHRTFLNMYKTLFAKNTVQIEFKTDNAPLFEFSVEEFTASGFEITYITRNLHAEVQASDNIQTEYERNFSAKGFAINKLIAKCKN